MTRKETIVVDETSLENYIHNNIQGRQGKKRKKGNEKVKQAPNLSFAGSRRSPST